MANKGKGKLVIESPPGKRNRKDIGDDRYGPRKRQNPRVLRFFDEAANVADNGSCSEDSLLDDEFVQKIEKMSQGSKVTFEPSKAQNLPFFLKEEVLSEEEVEKMLVERYKDGSGFVKYADDECDSKRSVDINYTIPVADDPTVWKVKCAAGRERYSSFCLMQKYIDLQSLGTKLNIISAFSFDNVKGFIYVEADRQCDVNEACKGLSTLYVSRVAPVQKNEILHLLLAPCKCSGISVGSWARVKNGRYKGDLAQIVAVNSARRKATIKLIPRISVQALIEKFGGGVPLKNVATPAPRLIRSNELEDFRPLIKITRDKETGMSFEVLDGLMLKDGFLFKKVNIDSLNCWGVVPSKKELQEFETSADDESKGIEWLTELYGEQTKKSSRLMNLKSDKGGGKGDACGKGGKGSRKDGKGAAKGEGTSGYKGAEKGEGTSGSKGAEKGEGISGYKGAEKGGGTSGSSTVNNFEEHDFVCFGRKDFGVIVGLEKATSYKILKEGAKGPEVVTVELHNLKNVPFDTKFTALDQHMKIISINDTVKVLEGPSKGRQGIAKQIYRGIIFLYDESEMENSGYFCSKSQMCEKVKLSVNLSNEKGGESGALGLEDFSSSPKSPLPSKSWQPRQNCQDFNRGDKDEAFSIGQKLRIRKGPLKGYLCRVMAVRRSDVTVKLDSKPQVLTVKCEFLCEFHEKDSANMDPGSSSVKPFELFGTHGGSTDWMEGAGTGAHNDGWNKGGASSERSSWANLSNSSTLVQTGASCADNSKGDAADDSWAKTVNSNQGSSWGTAVIGDNALANSDQVGGWGNGEGGWNKLTTEVTGDMKPAESWDKAKNLSATSDVGWNIEGGGNKPTKNGNSDQGGGWRNGDGGWNKLTTEGTSDMKSAESWDKAKNVSATSDVGWNSEGCWNKPTMDGSSFMKSTESWDKANNATATLDVVWNSAASDRNMDSWGKGKDVARGSVDKGIHSGGDASVLGKPAESQAQVIEKELQEKSWGKAAGKCRDGSSKESTAEWKSTTDPAVNVSGVWGNAGACLAQSQTESIGQSNRWNSNQVGDWGNPNFSDGGQKVSGWNKGAATSEEAGWATDHGHDWNKSDAPAKTQNNSWNAGASNLDGPQSGGWGSQKVSEGKSSGWAAKLPGDLKDGEAKDEISGWNNKKTSGGGSVSAWGQSNLKNTSSGGSEWGNKSNKSSGGENEDGGWGGNGTSRGGKSRGSFDRGGLGGSSSDNGGFCGRGSYDRGGFCGRGSSDRGGNWNHSNSSDQRSSGWNKGSAANEASGGTGTQGNDWSTTKASAGDRSSGWKSGMGAGIGSSDWDSKDCWGDGKAEQAKHSGWNSISVENVKNSGAKDEGSGWNSRTPSGGGTASGWDQSNNEKSNNSNGSWGSRKADEAMHSGWNKSSVENVKDNNTTDEGSGWNSRSSDGGPATGWGHSNSWKSKNMDRADWGQKSNWNVDQSEAGGGRDGNCWGGRGRGSSERGGFGGRGNSDRGGFGGRGSRGRDGFGGRGFGGRDSSDRGGFGGRGFGGRDNSDRGGFGGRGRSDRGGFRGRGRFNSGGFGGRGGGRDQSGDWNSGNSNEVVKGGWNSSNRTDEKKSFDWGKDSNSNGNGWKGGWSSTSVTSEKSCDWSKQDNDKSEGWQSHNATQSWNQGGQSSSKPPSVSSGIQGYGRNQSGNNEASGDCHEKASAWGKQALGDTQEWKNSDFGISENQGGGSTWESPSAPAGGEGTGWGKQVNNNNSGGWKGKEAAANSWNEGGGSTWKPPSSSGDTGGASNVDGGSKGASWNEGGGSAWKPPSAPGGDQGSGWN